jgi:hypothetical protein
MNEQNIPRDLQYAAMQFNLDEMKTRDAKNEELLKRLKQIEEEYTRELHDFLGPKSKEYKAFYEKRGQAAINMLAKFKPTTEGVKSEFEFDKKMLSEANEFIKNLGINTEDLKSIRKKYQKQLSLAFDKAAELPYSGPEAL